MSKKAFKKLLHLILRNVLIVPNDVLEPYKNEAVKIIKDIDLDDAPFIACALAYPNSTIWSDDKKLKQQSKIKILNTKEMIDYLDSRP
ncbi:hypothetical protein GF327_08395 [Candidatus Woesearchaeota archaeon]|nr:hypothetical protein [Candidatus Woesearchaeota archaeon]